MFREKLIKIWIIYCFFIAVSTELLSIFNLIDKFSLSVAYILGIVILLIIFRKKIKIPKIKIQFNNYFFWYLFLTIVILLPLLLIALYYPPNTFDSMTYHLSRVEHWIQNKNVEFYTVADDRQLSMMPLTEYMILHIRILFGNDIFVSLIQYLSMFFSAILATLIVKEWKGNKLSELLTACLVLTIPMGIMEATSTQTDYVTAFFTLATLYFCLKNDKFFLPLVISLGICAKSSYVFFALPIGIFWFINRLKNKDSSVWQKLFFITIATLLINFLFWKRNYQQYHTPTGPKLISQAIFVQTVKPKYFISSIVKNIGIQIGLPNEKYNLAVDGLVLKIHQILNIDVNNPINTFPLYGQQRTVYQTFFSTFEDLAGNFLISVLFIITGIILIFKKYHIWPWYLVSFFGWLLFTALFKWQPWLSRLELSFFVIICPIIGLTLTKFIQNELIIKSLILITVFLSLPFVIGYLPLDKDNPNVKPISNRPFVSDIFSFKKTRYQKFIDEDSSKLNFANSYSYYYIPNSYYSEIAKKLKSNNTKKIALKTRLYTYEYPLWAAIRYENLNIEINFLDKDFNFITDPDIGALVCERCDLTPEIYENAELMDIDKFNGLEVFYFKQNSGRSTISQ